MAPSAFRLETTAWLAALAATPLPALSELSTALAAAQAGGDGVRVRELVARALRPELAAPAAPAAAERASWAAAVAELAGRLLACRQAVFDARRLLTRVVLLASAAEEAGGGPLPASRRTLLWAHLHLAELAPDAAEEVAQVRALAALGGALPAAEGDSDLVLLLASADLELGRRGDSAALAAARTCYEELLAVLDPAAEPLAWGRAQVGCAEALGAEVGAPAEGAAERRHWHYQQALATGEQLGDKTLQVSALLGLVTSDQEELGLGEGWGSSCLERAAALVSRRDEPQLWARLQQAWGDYCADDLEQAVTHYQGALAVLRRHSSPYHWRRLCAETAAVWCLLGHDSDEAARVAGRYYRLALQCPWDDEARAQLHAGYAWVLLDLARGRDIALLQEALRHLARALRCLGPERHRGRRAHYQLRRSACLCALGRATGDRVCLRKAIDLCEQLQAERPSPWRACCFQHALALFVLGERAAAQEQLVATLGDLSSRFPLRFWLRQAARSGDAGFLALARMVAGMVTGDTSWNDVEL